jgi:hypothetical protein
MPGYDTQARWFWNTIVAGGVRLRPMLVRDDIERREHVPTMQLDATKLIDHSLGRLLEDGNMLMRLLLIWSALWSECGFPQVVIGHKTAASFMATSMPREVATDDVRLPWKAFLIRVPRDLLEFSPHREFVPEPEPVSRVHVVQWNKGDICILMSSPLGLVAMTNPGELGDLAENMVDDSPPFLDEPLSDVEKRALQLIGRLILGVCAEMSSPDGLHAIAACARQASRANSSTEPSLWTYTIRRDVKVDIRDAVRAYARGERSTTPNVKVLVRGHWRRQRHGADLAGTKVIHVEPYWRGPEDVPIAIRKHVIE